MSYSYTYKKEVHSSNDPSNEWVSRKVTLALDGNEIGYFSIDGKSIRGECFDTGNTCSMSINIEKEYQGRNLSKPMLQEMIKGILSDYPQIRGDQLLFIDVDASEGYWNRIGMKPHRYDLDTKRESSRARQLEGYGYELYFTFKDLYNYAMRITKGGHKKKHNTRRKKRSHRKSRRRT